MIQLTLQWIKNYAGTDSRFRSGFMLHSKQKISAVEAGPKNSLNLTVATEEGPVQTSLFFYPDTGTFRYAKCTCHTGMPCDHVIGSLLYVLYKKESLTETLQADKTNRMYDAFESLLVAAPFPSGTAPLPLEVTLSPRDAFSKVQNTSIQLKALFHTPYVIKNIEQFVTAVVFGKPYEIAKNLTYTPAYFRIDQTDRAIIDLLYDYYNTRKHMLRGQGRQVMTPLKASHQLLPGTYVARLLSLLENHPFNLDFDGLYFKDQHIKDRVEVDFYLTEDEADYQLSVNTYDVFFPMTDDYSYVFYNNQIAHIGPKERSAFRLFTHHLEEKVLEVPPRHLEEFVNKVYPVLELIGHVHMDKPIRERLARYPLKAQVHIDQVEAHFALRLTYKYGPHTLDILPENPHPTDEATLLLRNLELEHRIDTLIRQPKHHIDAQGRLTYDPEDGLYTFLDKQLPKLQQLCDVYYSDDFKNTYLKSQKQLTSQIRLNPVGNFLDLDFDMEDVSRQELFDLLRAVKEKKHYYKLSDGSFFTITDALTYQVTALDGRYDLNLTDEDSPLISTTLANAFYLDLLMGQGQSPPSYNRHYRQILEDIQSAETSKLPVPAMLSDRLRDYQKTGYRWMAALKSYGLGGILADDMGLGKTLQAITLIVASKEDLPSIIIAPTSLIYNWKEEIRRFAPQAVTKVVVGTKVQRHKLIQAITPSDIVITSYGSLKRDLSQYSGTFDHCIIDEAQHIKNPRSQNALSVKHLKANHKFALTGTPIENTLTELWSIFDFILPGYLGGHEDFVKNFERPIVKEKDTDMLTRLTQLIQPFILRRLKEDVLSELPPKIESKISVELSNHQKKLYMAYVEQAKADVAAYSDIPMGQRNLKILSILTRLRQLCCHPSLFVADYKHGASKLDLLMELVSDSIEGGHRVLVFSQFTTMLAIIQATFEKHHIDYFYLDGSVPPIKRQQMVHDFNTGVGDVFLISLKAGGTGLNLTDADVVIHYDPWWNPAVENQATDRAYRIGQKNRVQVYKLITTGTIEEKIYALQQQKMSLIDTVIKPGETFLNTLSMDELQSLFLD